MEHDEQKFLFDALETLKREHESFEYIFAIPNGGHRHMSVARYMKDEGARSGVPDIFIPYPCGGFHGMWIEMKFGKNKLSVRQTEYFQYLRENGYRCEVCYSGKDALYKIFDYLGLNKNIIQFY